ncbi:MAG TPA: hypothetical protein VM598_03660 [Bdellovibrionota bacterium]|nr:hypothetical protein [Bdellovibrionota bacterium]
MTALMRAGMVIAAIGLSGLALCGCGDEEPGSTAPAQIDEVPVEAEEHIFVCASGRDDVDALVGRCVLSPIDAGALARTIERWSAAQPTWNDTLFETESFGSRYVMTGDERACLKSALCKEMPRD